MPPNRAMKYFQGSRAQLLWELVPESVDKDGPSVGGSHATFPSSQKLNYISSHRLALPIYRSEGTQEGTARPEWKTANQSSQYWCYTNDKVGITHIIDKKRKCVSLCLSSTSFRYFLELFFFSFNWPAKTWLLMEPNLNNSKSGARLKSGFLRTVLTSYINQTFELCI